jgi:hypothetical protein
MTSGRAFGGWPGERRYPERSAPIPFPGKGFQVLDVISRCSTLTIF